MEHLNLYYINGDWGLGIGDWGLGIGDWAHSPIPNTHTQDINIIIFFIQYIIFKYQKNNL